MPIINISWDPSIVLKNADSVTDIINKEITSNLATLTTSGAHYMAKGDWVTIQDIDATFDGTYEIISTTTNTFSYYKNNTNIASEAISPPGTYIRNSTVNEIKQYDLWIRWDRVDDPNGEWSYKGRIPNNTSSFPVPDFYVKNEEVQPLPPDRFSIEVYAAGYPIERGNGIPGSASAPTLKLYESTANVGRYEIQFNGNGSTSGNPPETLSGITGEPLTIPNQNTLEKTNYKFNYWNTSADGSGTTYNAGESVSNISGNITLYAQWIVPSVLISLFNPLDQIPKDQIPPALNYYNIYKTFNFGEPTSKFIPTDVPLSYEVGSPNVYNLVNSFFYSSLSNWNYDNATLFPNLIKMNSELKPIFQNSLQDPMGLAKIYPGQRDVAELGGCVNYSDNNITFDVEKCLYIPGSISYNYGNNDFAFLTKYDSSGKLSWSKYIYAGPNSDPAAWTDLIVDNRRIYLECIAPISYDYFNHRSWFAASGIYGEGSIGIDEAYYAMVLAFNENGVLLDKKRISELGLVDPQGSFVCVLPFDFVPSNAFPSNMFWQITDYLNPWIAVMDVTSPNYNNTPSTLEFRQFGFNGVTFDFQGYIIENDIDKNIRIRAATQIGKYGDDGEDRLYIGGIIADDFSPFNCTITNPVASVTKLEILPQPVTSTPPFVPSGPPTLGITWSKDISYAGSTVLFANMTSFYDRDLVNEYSSVPGIYVLSSLPTIDSHLLIKLDDTGAQIWAKTISIKKTGVGLDSSSVDFQSIKGDRICSPFNGLFENSMTYQESEFINISGIVNIDSNPQSVGGYLTPCSVMIRIKADGTVNGEYSVETPFFPLVFEIADTTDVTISNHTTLSYLTTTFTLENIPDLAIVDGFLEKEETDMTIYTGYGE